MVVTGLLYCCLFLGHSAEFKIGRLKYSGGGDWYASPTAIPNWLKWLRQDLGMQTASDEILVDLQSDLLYQVHILFATGHGNISFSPEEARNLRRYLLAGGFLFVNDSYGMDSYFRRSIKTVFPDKTLEPVSSEHPIYRVRYNLPGLPKIHEHDGEPAQGFALYHEGRMLVFYVYSSDIGDGLEDVGVHPNPLSLREKAFQMISNLTYFRLHPEVLF